MKIVICAWSLLFSCIFLVAYLQYIDYEHKGGCVLVKPLKVIDGKMYTRSGLLGGFTDIYSIEYQGYWSANGEECTVKKQVTEAEYSKQMFGFAGGRENGN